MNCRGLTQKAFYISFGSTAASWSMFIGRCLCSCRCTVFCGIGGPTVVCDPFRHEGGLGEQRSARMADALIQFLGIEAALVQLLGIEAALIQLLGIEAALIQLHGIEAALMQLLGIEAALIQFLGIEAALLQLLGIVAALVQLLAVEAALLQLLAFQVALKSFILKGGKFE